MRKRELSRLASEERLRFESFESKVWFLEGAVEPCNKVGSSGNMPKPRGKMKRSIKATAKKA